MCPRRKNLKWVKGIEREGITDKVAFKCGDGSEA